MSKTFGQLKVGDEVYVINGNRVEIVKVEIDYRGLIKKGLAIEASKDVYNEIKEE